MIQSLLMLHDVDRVSISDTCGLVTDGGKIVKARSITVKSGETETRITLFATDVRSLDIVEEG